MREGCQPSRYMGNKTLRQGNNNHRGPITSRGTFSIFENRNGRWLESSETGDSDWVASRDQFMGATSQDKGFLFLFFLPEWDVKACVPAWKKNEPMVSPVWSVDRTQRTGLHDGAQVGGKESRMPPAVMKAARSHSSQGSLLRWLHFAVRGRVCLLETLAREENKPRHCWIDENVKGYF